MSIRIARALPLILALAACSTPTQRVERLAAYELDPHSSFARNVMMASGRPMIRDGVGPEGGSVTARQGGGSVATIGAGALTGSPGLGVGLGLLRGLEGDGYNRGQTNMVLAWMPAELASDGRHARDQLNDILLSIFPPLLVQYGFIVEASEPWSSRSHGIERIQGFVVDYPSCSVSCGQTRYFMAVDPLAETETPHFIGTGRSYATLGVRGVGTPSWGQFALGDVPIDELALYRELSAELPAWAFVYLAPNQWASCEADGCRIRSYPLLLHRGEAHFFAKAGTDIASSE